MRRQLNTLYVTTDGAWLRKDGANIVMDVEGEVQARLPVHMLESLRIPRHRGQRSTVMADSIPL